MTHLYRKLTLILCSLSLAFSSLLSLPAHAWVPDSSEIVDTKVNGSKGNNPSIRPEISADGRYVAFLSLATDLVVPNTVDGILHAYRKDMSTGEVTILDVDNNGNPAGNGVLEIRSPQISADGTKTIFETSAPLVPEDTNNLTDLYMHDSSTNTTTRISVGDQGQQSDHNVNLYWLAGDGVHVFFEVDATNLVQGESSYKNRIYVRDLSNNTTSVVPTNVQGSLSLGQTSTDGRFVTYTDSYTVACSPTCTTTYSDIYALDRQSNTSQRVTVSSSGEVADQNGGEDSAISGDGRYVTFHSNADNLTNNATNQTQNIFIRDLVAGTTELLSVSTNGQLANNASYFSRMSADGRFVIFDSQATNLAPNPQPVNQSTIYVRDRLNNRTERATPDGTVNTLGQVISADGAYVALAAAFNPNPSTTWTIYRRSIDSVFPPNNTLVGTNVHVNLPPVSLTFSQVDVDGYTVAIPGNTGAQAPAGYLPGYYPATYYEVATGAVFSGNVEICINYNPDVLQDTEDRARIMQYVSGSWTNITSSLDTTNNLVCGNTASLGNFTVMTQALPPQHNTTTGSNINVSLPPVGLTFDNVAQAGDTTVTTSSTGNAPPSGFKLGNPPTYYNISTTAQFNGNVEVCINYDDSSINGQETNLKMMHFEPGVGWQDITTSLDTTQNIICGITTGFSAFALMTQPTIQGLISRVSDMNVQQGIQNSLDAKLQDAQSALDAQRNNNISQAVNTLTAFKQEVAAQKNVKLTASQADELTNWANNLITAIQGTTYGQTYTT